MSASPERSSPSAVEKCSLNHSVLSPIAWGPVPTGNPRHTAPSESRMVHSPGVPYQTWPYGASGGYGSGGTNPSRRGTVTGHVFAPADEAELKPPVERSVAISSRAPIPAHADT